MFIKEADFSLEKSLEEKIRKEENQAIKDKIIWLADLNGVMSKL